MTVISSLFKHIIRLNEGTDTPPWVIQLWDDTNHEWRSLGSNLGGSGHCSLLQLRGDPPDFVTINGETISVESG